MLGTECDKGGEDTRISADQAFEVARLLGLPSELIHAPESFNVGKGARKLSPSSQQLICLARIILSDPDVLMLYNPTVMLSDRQADTVLLVLQDFAEKGGLWGVLDPENAPETGSTEAHYLTGNGRRTVLITMSSREEQQGVPDVVSDIVYCKEFREAPQSPLASPKESYGCGWKQPNEGLSAHLVPLVFPEDSEQHGIDVVDVQPRAGDMPMPAVMEDRGSVEPPAHILSLQRLEQPILEIHESYVWSFFTAVCTAWALGGDDIYLLTDPPLSLDRKVFSMHLVAFLQFTLDAIFRSLLNKAYRWGFFFWLDVVATL